MQRLTESVGLEATVRYRPSMTRQGRRSLALPRKIAGKLQAELERTLVPAQQNLERMGAAASVQPPRKYHVMLSRFMAVLLPVLTDTGCRGGVRAGGPECDRRQGEGPGAGQLPDGLRAAGERISLHAMQSGAAFGGVGYGFVGGIA